jgi:putative exosortase-associated protein (TIGR04073 family)
MLMRMLKQYLFISLAILSLVIIPTTSFAALTGGTTAPSGPQKVFFDTSEKPLGVRMLWKFNRGHVNLITAPWELINQPFIYASNQEQILGVFTGLGTGLFMGIGWMFVRIGIGIFDIVTFPFPIKNYQTIIYPEFVF